MILHSAEHFSKGAYAKDGAEETDSNGFLHTDVAAAIAAALKPPSSPINNDPSTAFVDCTNQEAERLRQNLHQLREDCTFNEPVFPSIVRQCDI